MTQDIFLAIHFFELDSGREPQDTVILTHYDIIESFLEGNDIEDNFLDNIFTYIEREFSKEKFLTMVKNPHPTIIYESENALLVVSTTYNDALAKMLRTIRYYKDI